VQRLLVERHRDTRDHPAGPPTGSNRVLRGGAHASSGERIRSSFRTFLGPTNAYSDLGFCVARLP
jgi:formylglycine-generating enzyme required for sulfatase activity